MPSTESRSRPPEITRARVADAMHAGVVACTPETPLAEVAGLMAAHRVHCVVVDGIAGEGDGVTWAVASDLDVTRALACERDPGACTAIELAATEAVTVRPRDTLLEAARLMSEHDVHHLVVVEARGGRPAGVLSTLDLARFVAAPTAPE